MFSFVESKLFTRLVGDYLTDDEYSQLQGGIGRSPGNMVRSFQGRVEFASCDGRSQDEESGAGSG